MAAAQRQWAEAEAACRQALAIKIEFDRHSQASTYPQLGMVAAAQRQWAEAEAACRQALAIFDEFNDRHNQALTYHQLGNVAAEQRQWAEAKSHLLKALEIFAAFDDQHHTAMTLRNLARLWRESGDDSVLAATAQQLGMPEEDVKACSRPSSKTPNRPADPGPPASVFRPVAVQRSASAIRC